jgi:hypothetical protein
LESQRDENEDGKEKMYLLVGREKKRTKIIADEHAQTS